MPSAVIWSVPVLFTVPMRCTGTPSDLSTDSASAAFSLVTETMMRDCDSLKSATSGGGPSWPSSIDAPSAGLAERLDSATATAIAAFRKIVGALDEPLANDLAYAIVQSLLRGVVEARREAGLLAEHHLEVMRAADLVAEIYREQDHVARRLEGLRRHVLLVRDLADHADRRGRVDRAVRAFVSKLTLPPSPGC